MRVARVALVSSLLGIQVGCSSGSGGGGGNQTPAKHYLAVADANNNRVLIYDSPVRTGEGASIVLGQPDFTTKGQMLSAGGLGLPMATALDGAGNLYVVDSTYSRVLQYAPPFTTHMDASVVIGQLDFVTGGTNTAENGLRNPTGLAFDPGGNLWIADTWNNRVLEFWPPFHTGMYASVVIGQVDYTSRGTSLTSSGLLGPWSIAFDPAGNLWVVDTNHHRVLEFKRPFSNGMSASLVIGQPDFTSGAIAIPPRADTLNNPGAIAFDGNGGLWVGDNGNNRILRFVPPFATGMSASLVLGATDFVTNACVVTSTGLCTMDGVGIAFDSGGNLWVADGDNRRTLEFTPPFSTGQGANLVLGQTSFTFSASATTASGQDSPYGVAAF